MPTMSNYKGKNITTFQNINLRGLDSSNPGMIKVEGGGFHGTATVNTSYLDQDVAWTLPAKSGGIPLAGTFQISIPSGAVATLGVYSTAVTVSGIRVEDLVMCQFTGAFATAGLSIVSAAPTAANTITVYISNTSGGTLNVLDRTVSYVVYR